MAYDLLEMFNQNYGQKSYTSMHLGINSCLHLCYFGTHHIYSYFHFTIVYYKYQIMVVSIIRMLEQSQLPSPVPLSGVDNWHP